LHQGESAQEIMVRAAWTPAPRVADRGLGIPEVVADIIDKACHFEAKDRFESAGRMKAALEAARDILAITSPPAIAAVRRTSPSSSSISLSPISRPSSDAVETMFDKSPLPTDSASVRTSATFAKRRRRRNAWIAIAIAGLVGIVALVWIQNQKSEGQAAASSPRVQTEAPHAAPPVPAQPIAPSSTPQPPAPPPEPEPAATEAAAQSPTANPLKARLPAPVRRPPRPGAPPPAAESPAKPAPAPAAAPKSAPAASAGKPSMGRDIGY